MLPLVEYVVYEDYIAEFLCINKSNTELECNGKCYLMQRISEQHNEKKQSLPKIALEEYPIGFVELYFFSLKAKRNGSNLVESSYVNLYSYTFTLNTFHPPSFFSFSS
ncbi:hypothetical protein [uncultured Croceitalea sp.]|uniref:hypothetical protein n=1 Tax=uncultured Croceitalea sp. TaxID=1798908 RepID=UPI0033062CB3